MEINQEWIDQQRKVCEAATVAPWSWNGDALTSHWTDVISVSDNEGGASFSLEIDESDRAFIASARTALPSALDALEAAYAEIARLTAERDAESEQIQEIGRFALEQQEATALCELFDAMWTVRAMCGSTIQCTENENAPTGAESEGEHA